MVTSTCPRTGTNPCRRWCSHRKSTRLVGGSWLSLDLVWFGLGGYFIMMTYDDLLTD